MLVRCDYFVMLEE